MSDLPTLAEIDRAHRLFSNRTALKILDALRRGESLDAAALDADQHNIQDAVLLLTEMDLVEPTPVQGPPAHPRPALTSRGKGLVDLLEEISQDAR